jgi:tetratricopeptide (TPR) repeat protein
VSAHLERGRLLLQQGRTADAIGEFTLAAGEDPENPMTHTLLAECHCELEAYDEAMREAQMAISLAPDWAVCHITYARVLMVRERMPEALDALNEALVLAPDDIYCYQMRAVYHQRMREWSTLLEVSEAGLRIDPGDVDCANSRATALTMMGRTEDAVNGLAENLMRDPDDPDTHANLGWTKLHQNAPKEALVHFREALRLAPDNEWARSGLVEALKASNPIYALFMRYFLSMSRLGQQASWGILIGLYVLYRVLLNVAETNESVGPFIRPFLVLYVIFALMTWISYPLFNLTLFLHRTGRYALSDDQRRGAMTLGTMIAVALGLAVAGWLIPSDLFLAVAMITGLCVMPSAVIFSCERGWPRQSMAAITIGLWALGMMGLFQLAPFNFFFYGILASLFGANALTSARVQR